MSSRRCSNTEQIAPLPASLRRGTFGGGSAAFIVKLKLPTVALSAATASVSESAGRLNLTVRLSTASIITVQYATSDGTAMAGSDAIATSGRLTEAFTSDANGARLTRTVTGVPTVDLARVWEEVVGGAVTVYYPFNGTVVAMRQGSDVTPLHGDHPALRAGPAWARSAWRPARAGPC